MCIGNDSHETIQSSDGPYGHYNKSAILFNVIVLRTFI